MTRLLAPFAALALSACGPLTFTTQLAGTGTVQGNPLGGLLNVFPTLSSFASIDFNQNQDFKNNNTAKDKVTAVHVKSLTLQLTSPNDQGFGFLDSVQFVAEANGQRAVFASKSGVASLGLNAPNPTLTLDLPDVDLASYVRADTVTLALEGSGRPPPKDTTLEAKVSLQVAVRVF